MLWKEVKSWAKKYGYESRREKIEDSDNRYNYYWSKIDDPSISGVSSSVSKLSLEIYNLITDNKWVEYQKQYQESKEIEFFSVNDYGK